MNIAIIGAGLTGLSAGYRLGKLGHNVFLFEKESLPGGLAVGLECPQWKWTLEQHYHHWFTNDKSALSLAKEINYEVLIKRPKTSAYVDGKIYQLDSPLSVLQFPKITIFERIRTATVLGLLRYNPLWQPLENLIASSFLPKAMGKKTYELLWEPLLKSKFGSYMNDISLAWFWARIKKRTAELAYPKGGFLKFANALVSEIEKNGGKVIFNAEVEEIKNNKQIVVKGKIEDYDAVIVTLPSFLFLKIAPQLPFAYQEKLRMLKGLSAVNLILRLKKPFLTDGTYWLNICDKNSPIMAIVEHTNFIDKRYYNNEHIVYLGNYISNNHPYMKMNADELLKIYAPYLKRINPDFQFSISNSQLFKAPFAQPIIPINYSKILPPFETPLKNVYLANIQQIYPWDRGTNYAIELGERVAKLIDNC